MRGFITGILLLVGLQAVVTRGSGRVGAAFTGVAAVIDHVVNPAVPAIPDLRGGDWDSRSTLVPSSAPMPAQPALPSGGLATTRPTPAPINA